MREKFSAGYSGGVRSVGSVVWTEDGKPQEHCFSTRKLFLQNF